MKEVYLQYFDTSIRCDRCYKYFHTIGKYKVTIEKVMSDLVLVSSHLVVACPGCHNDLTIRGRYCKTCDPYDDETVLLNLCQQCYEIMLK